MRRRTLIICFSLLAAALIAVPAGTSAAGKKAKASTPKITRVMPMRLVVGQTVTIRGRNFKAKRNQNTVIFRAPNGRTAFAKPKSASRHKLVVVVPPAVARLAGTKAKRFKLRVLAGKFSSWTSRRLSPVILLRSGAPGGPGRGGGGSGASGSCGSGSDWDGDLLANTLEAQLKTNPCAADSDGDSVEDGFEYKSAIDLNDDEFQDPNRTLPYPGKRP